MIIKIYKIKKDIKDIVKYACSCCQTLCFLFQIRSESKLHLKKTPRDFKQEKILNYIFSM
jgi:hypothetical protein